MYIALKPCTISGSKYIINDEVDVSMLADSDIAALCKRKVVVSTDTGKPATNDDTLNVPIIDKDEAFDVTMTAAQLCEVVTIVQRAAAAAVEATKLIEDENQLILIHRLDTRKTVQEAAVARAKEIKPEEGEK